MNPWLNKCNHTCRHSNIHLHTHPQRKMGIFISSIAFCRQYLDFLFTSIYASYWIVSYNNPFFVLELSFLDIMPYRNQLNIFLSCTQSNILCFYLPSNDRIFTSPNASDETKNLVITRQRNWEMIWCCYLLILCFLKTYGLRLTYDNINFITL